MGRHDERAGTFQLRALEGQVNPFGLFNESAQSDGATPIPKHRAWIVAAMLELPDGAPGEGLFARRAGMNIIKAIYDPNLIGAAFPDLSSWQSWMVALKASNGLDLNDPEVEVFKKHTGRTHPPTVPAKEVFFIVGRRGGKGRVTAATGAYLAAFRDYSQILAPGEKGLLPIIASDREQAKIVLNYIRDIFLLSPILRQMVEKDDLTWEIPLKNRVTIRVMTCSKAAIRGWTLVGAVAEEIAYWASEGVRQDQEVIRALRPGRLTTKGPLIVISTPYRRMGVLWEAYRKHYGQDSSTLIWVGDSLSMNPTLDLAEIEEEIKNDPESGKTEYYCDFRSDLEDFLPLEALEAVIIPGRFELPPLPNCKYHGFLDHSSGRGDAAALCVAHQEKEKVILDVARRWPAPHDPSSVMFEVAQILQAYGISRITADKYAVGFIEAELRRHNITYEPSDKTASTLYLEFLPLILSGSVELLDNRHLVGELTALERRVRAGGHDSVSHGPSKNAHDDLSNACAGVCVQLAVRRKREVRIITEPYGWRPAPEPVPGPPLHHRLQYLTPETLSKGE